MRLVKSAGVRRAARLFLALIVPVLSLSPLLWAHPAQTSASTISFQSHHIDTSSPSAAALSIKLADSMDLNYIPGELLVKLSSPEALTSSSLNQTMDRFGLSVGDEVLPGVYKMTSADGADLNINAASAALQSTGLVSYAQPNHIYKVDKAPNDEEYVGNQQWYVSQVDAEEAWDVTTGSQNITIGVIDTGTAYDHPDLEGKYVGGYDFYNQDDDPYDDFGHGTMTAGIAAAIGNNSIGIAGLSWGARIMPVKVLGGSNGEGTDEMVAAGIRWAVDHGANILNVSLGGDEDSAIQEDAIKYAYDKNVLFIAAAGNSPDGKPHYPAASDYAMAVGATVRNDAATGFSSYGPYLDISAPGVGILSTSWDNGKLGYEYGNGTSFACPIVVGVAALVWGINPGFSAQQVRYILEDSSDDIGPQGWDEYTGRGRLNAFKAVQLAQQIAAGGVLPTRTPSPVPQPTTEPEATATPGASQPASIQLDSNTAAPGGLLAIIGSGFDPNESVDFDIRLPADAAARGLGNAQANAIGDFRAEVALPKDVPIGSARLNATGTSSGRQASVDLTVVAGVGLGQSAIKGTVRGADPGTVTVYLQPSLGVNAPEISIQPDGDGAFTFDNLASGFYALSAAGPTGMRIGPYTVQVDGTAGDIKTIDFLIPQPRPLAFDRVPPLTNTEQVVYFPEVGHTLKGPFLKFWNENGGLAIFGYPISEEFQDINPADGQTYAVQYFERNRFEYHPEFSGSSNDVLMGLLGVEVTKGRIFPPEAPVQITPTQVYFNETQHSLKGAFLKYWNDHGGLAIFGYPISGELVEDGYLVQYFERNRFEYHLEYAGTPNEVLLGLLGTEVARRNGWVTP